MRTTKMLKTTLLALGLLVCLVNRPLQAQSAKCALQARLQQSRVTVRAGVAFDATVNAVFQATCGVTEVTAFVEGFPPGVCLAAKQGECPRQVKVQLAGNRTGITFGGTMPAGEYPIAVRFTGVGAEPSRNLSFTLRAQ